MYRYMLSVFALVMGVSPVFAADAISKKNKTILEPTPAAYWQGFYAGRSIGYGFSRVHSKSAGSVSYDMNGVSGSVLMGYNWQRGSWVYGFEGDIAIHEIKGKTAGNGGVAGHEGDNLWTAAFKGRLGYDMGRFLPFVTAGVAWGEFHQHNWPGTFYFGDVKYQTGWTASAGVDARVWGPFVGRLEYVYTDFPTQSYNLVSSTIRSNMATHMFRAAVIYKPDARDKTKNYALKGNGTAVDWSGYYSGVMTGFRNTSAKTTSAAGSTTFHADGAMGGFYGGYNWVWNSAWVLGFDGELMLAGINANKGATALPAMHYSEVWTAAARLRAGYSFGALLPYVTAGIQYGQFEQSVPGTGSTAVEPLHSWTVGAGLDWRFSPEYSARLDYAYARSFDTANPGLDATRYATKTDSHTIKAGIAYHFGM